MEESLSLEGQIYFWLYLIFNKTPGCFTRWQGPLLEKLSGNEDFTCFLNKILKSGSVTGHPCHKSTNFLWYFWHRRAHELLCSQEKEYACVCICIYPAMHAHVRRYCSYICVCARVLYISFSFTCTHACSHAFTHTSLLNVHACKSNKRGKRRPEATWSQDFQVCCCVVFMRVSEEWHLPDVTTVISSGRLWTENVFPSVLALLSVWRSTVSAKCRQTDRPDPK